MILIVINNAIVFNQDKSKQIKEYVSVKSVEIIIRAMRKSHPVAGLKETDFILLENGKKMKITSLTEVSRKIGSNKIEMEDGVKQKVKLPKRLFLLYFWLFEPELKFQEILDSFFQNIYREGDIVLLTFRDLQYKIEKKDQILPRSGQLIKEIQLASKNAKMEKDRIIRDLEFLCYEVKNRRALPGRLEADFNFNWKFYKYKYLVLNIKHLLALAESLKPIKLEKWSLVFYQNHTFPQFDPTGDLIAANEQKQARLNMFAKFFREMSVPVFSKVHKKKIQEAFISANATFHFLLVGSVTKGLYYNPSLRMNEVTSDWQVSFRDIAKATGGETMQGNAFKTFINRVIEKEDVYYRLTYSPRELDKHKRRIKIKANTPGIMVFYNRLVDIKPEDFITLSDFSFVDPTLSFTLKGYRMLHDQDKIVGQVELKIKLVDDDQEEFSINKVLALTGIKTDVSLKLNFPHPGNYRIYIEAIDTVTGAKVFFDQKINCSHGKKMKKTIQPELAEILKNTALYCEKLKKAILHFYCIERVTEKIERSFQYHENQRGLKDFLEEKRQYWGRTGDVQKKISIKKAYTYDYQIIQDKTNIKEQRILINDNGKKVHQANPSQKTVLYTYKNTLIPILLFSQNNQQNYTFHIKSKKKIMGRRTHVISVSSKYSPEPDKNLATFWVDCQDFSILKFEVFPGAIRGYNNLLRINKKIMSDIKITDTHLFGHIRNGIRYPSQTKIKISFKAKSSGKTHAYGGVRLKTSIGLLINFKISTVIRYKKYKFFDVTVNTDFKDLK